MAADPFSFFFHPGGGTPDAGSWMPYPYTGVELSSRIYMADAPATDTWRLLCIGDTTGTSVEEEDMDLVAELALDREIWVYDYAAIGDRIAVLGLSPDNNPEGLIWLITLDEAGTAIATATYPINLFSEPAQWVPGAVSLDSAPEANAGLFVRRVPDSTGWTEFTWGGYYGQERLQMIIFGLPDYSPLFEIDRNTAVVERVGGVVNRGLFWTEKSIPDA